MQACPMTFYLRYQLFYSREQLQKSYQTLMSSLQ
jgi:hypothetical protein